MSNHEAELLVVHGHELTSENMLDAHTRQRMDTALGAWQQGMAENFAVSGGYSFMLRTPPPEAEATVMRKYALEHGVPEEKLHVEDESLDTIGNALFTTTKIAIPNGWSRLAVVTSESHLPRMLEVYRHVCGNGFEIQGIPAQETVRLKEKIYEPLGAAMVRAVFQGTKPGDHQAIQERLFDLVPGYADGNFSRLAFKSLVGLLRK